MFPMQKKSGESLRDINQPFECKISWSLPEPTKFVTNPVSKTEVKSTKHMPHFRLTEFAIVIDPPPDF